MTKKTSDWTDHYKKMKQIRIGKFNLPIDDARGVKPLYSMILQHRIKQKRSCITAITGEPGSGKSYKAIGLAVLHDPTFSIRQIVFTYTDYLNLLMELKPGQAIVLDEPSWVLSARDWFRDLNKALAKIIESQRFLCHPLFIPVLSIHLLDKIVRDYCLNFHIVMQAPGHSRAYSLQASPFENKTYRNLICTMQSVMIDQDKCSKESCLSCRKIDICQLIRGQYEKKKRDIQMPRYKAAKEEASKTESKEFSLSQLEEATYQLKNLIVGDDNKIDADRIMTALEDEKGISISRWKARQIAKRLKIHFQNEF